MGIVLGRKPGGGSSSGGAPSGAAGGDLAGTYPNPTIAAAYTAARISNTIVDAKGDLIAGTAADTVARVAVGTNGRPLTADSAAAGGVSYLPLELSYVAFTSDAVCTATTEAAADTIVTAAAITFDGSTPALIEFYAPYWTQSSNVQAAIVVIYDGASSIGRIFQTNASVISVSNQAIYVAHRLTPSAAAHTYSIRGFVSGASTFTVGVGAGGSGAFMPGFVRITRTAS